MSAPPAPRGPHPPNTFQQYGVGSVLTVKTKTGDTFTGTVRVTAREFMILVGESGTLNVWTGSVLSVENHRPSSRSV